MLLLVLLLLLPLQAFSATYYASPTGGGNGSSQSSPFKMSNFLSVSQPGDTLFLLNGVYTDSQSMLNPTSGKSGTSSNPITIKALNDGDVFITGSFTLYPFSFSNNNWWVIEGINFANSAGEALFFFQSNNNVLRRVCAWNAQPPAPLGNGINLHTMLVWESSNNTFEDMCAFGYGRNTVNDIGGSTANNTFRRMWLKWDGWFDTQEGSGGPPFQAGYFTAQTSRYENLITIWSSEKHVWPQAPLNPSGGFIYRSGDFDQSGNGNTVAGLIVYGVNNPIYPLSNGAFWVIHRWVPNTLRDMFIDARSQQQSAPMILGCDKEDSSENAVSGQCNNYTSIADRITTIRNPGQASSLIDTASTHTLIQECTSLGSCPDFYTGSGPSQGSRACFEYQNGILGTTPLWPWRMDLRIKEALRLAGHKPLSGSAGTGYGANTVTSEIVSRYGSIPSQCLRVQ